MDESRLISLPIELQESIVIHVCRGSLEDLLNIKQTCKELKEVSELPSVYASIDLLKFTYNQFLYGASFVVKCYYSGNPYAIYIKGTQDFFIHGEPVQGLRMIKAAADMGCEFALYTYAMVRKTLYDDDVALSQIAREFIIHASSRLFLYRMGRLHVLHALAVARNSFVELMLPLIYQCSCSPRKSTFSWCRYDSEDRDLCDVCFRLNHLGVFSHYFSVVILPETRLW